MKKNETKREYPQRLIYAFIALSFFRSRHQRTPRYKSATGTGRGSQTVSVYADYVRMAKQYIKKARNAGFKGSVIAATDAN